MENQQFAEKPISRRTFLKGTAGAALLVVSAGAIGTALAACAPGKATADFEITSSTDLFHAHTVKILGADVDKPPAEKTIDSSSINNHTHSITLKKADYDAIKSGKTVTVTSTSTGGTPHTHTFAIKLPA